MTDTATETSAPTTPEGQLAYFRERRELAVTQPQGSLALTNDAVGRTAGADRSGACPAPGRRCRTGSRG